MNRWDVHHCFTLGPYAPVKGDDVLDSPAFVRGMTGRIKGEASLAQRADRSSFDVTVVRPSRNRIVCIDGILTAPGEIDQQEALDLSWALFVNATRHQFAGIMQDHAYDDGGVTRLAPEPAEPVDPFSVMALSYINEHRRGIGMVPLDPHAASWTQDDVMAEFERIRGLRGMMPNPHVRALERRLGRHRR